jgi:hypothetical protein
MIVYLLPHYFTRRGCMRVILLLSERRGSRKPSALTMSCQKTVLIPQGKPIPQRIVA